MNVFQRATVILGLLLIAAVPNGELSAINDAVITAMRASNVPGAEVGIAQDDHLVVERSYGVRNLRTQVPVTVSTRFEIGSITKQFTAAAILQLKEDGKITLADVVGKYLPQYPRAKRVTIEQLLWQVSGIPDYSHTKTFDSVASRNPGSVDAIIALVRNEPLDFAPGTKWEYSNTNYVLLGAIVSRVSHMTWEQYLQKYIFAKAGMSNTAFIQDEARIANMATGYTVDRTGQVVIARPYGEQWVGAAGSIVSTAADIAKWDTAFFGNKIVDASDVRLATTPRSGAEGYGFGWFIGNADGQPRYWHDGGTPGFTAQNNYFPKLRQSVVVLTNIQKDAFIGIPVFEALNPAIASAAEQSAPGEDPKVTILAREWIRRFQTGDIDKSQLTPQMATAFTPAVTASFKAQMGSLGEPTRLTYLGKSAEGTSVTYRYHVKFKSAQLNMQLLIDAQGKLDISITG